MVWSALTPLTRHSLTLSLRASLLTGITSWLLASFLVHRPRNTSRAKTRLTIRPRGLVVRFGGGKLRRLWDKLNDRGSGAPKKKSTTALAEDGTGGGTRGTLLPIEIFIFLRLLEEGYPRPGSHAIVRYQGACPYRIVVFSWPACLIG